MANIFRPHQIHCAPACLSYSVFYQSCSYSKVRHEQWTCLEMWNGPMATRAPGTSSSSSLLPSSSPFAGLPRLHRTLSELEIAPAPPANDEDAYLRPLTEKDFQVWEKKCLLSLPRFEPLSMCIFIRSTVCLCMCCSLFLMLII